MSNLNPFANTRLLFFERQSGLNFFWNKDAFDENFAGKIYDLRSFIKKFDYCYCVNFISYKNGFFKKIIANKATKHL
jgi:hypothetical protein